MRLGQTHQTRWWIAVHYDLHLANLSIRAGVNQTIISSLAMVFVASLIGTKRLGEDVLEAFQYANVGPGFFGRVCDCVLCNDP